MTWSKLAFPTRTIDELQFRKQMFNHVTDNRAQKPNFTILFPQDSPHIKVKTDSTVPTEATRRMDETRGYVKAMRPGRFLTRQITRGSSPINNK